MEPKRLPAMCMCATSTDTNRVNASRMDVKTHDNLEGNLSGVEHIAAELSRLSTSPSSLPDGDLCVRLYSSSDSATTTSYHRNNQLGGNQDLLQDSPMFCCV